MNYAGFWKRFRAWWIDFLILMGPMLLLVLASSYSRTLALVCAIPLGFIFWFYTFFLHAKSGQTIGKRAMQIRVVRVDGSKIGYHEAFLRGIVELAFIVLLTVGILYGYSIMVVPDYAALGWLGQQEKLSDLMPPVFDWIGGANNIWMWAEVVMLLSNEQKRAIHDLMAGTVVVDEKPPEMEE